HAMVACLGVEGIEAQVMNELTLGGFEGLTAWLPGKASLRGLEVWVVNPTDSDRARQIVADKEAELAKIQTTRTENSEPVGAQCEECGTSSSHGPESAGTVQSCPHCGAYVDVPGGDDDNEVVQDSAEVSADESES